MSESTFLRANQDRIVIHSSPQGWEVTYYRATTIRGSWLRRLFGAPPVFRQVLSTPGEIHAVLMRHNLNLTRAEMQRLNSMMNVLQARDRALVRRLA